MPFLTLVLYTHNMASPCADMASWCLQKAEVLDGDTDQSFLNAVAVMPLFARSVAAELREASDQIGEPYCCLQAYFLRPSRFWCKTLHESPAVAGVLDLLLCWQPVSVYSVLRNCMSLRYSCCSCSQSLATRLTCAPSSHSTTQGLAYRDVPGSSI